VQQEESSGKRRYRMGARAESKAATGERILEAAIAVFDENPTSQVTMPAIAARAGVSVQTMMRHFGSRDGVFAASVAHLSQKMGADRGPPPVGDVRAAVGPLVDHYERFGDRILRLLAEEPTNPTFHMLAEGGRIYHLHWCETAFGPALEGLRGVKRERLIAQFVTLTDIQTWKLLRRDRGLSKRQTKEALYELIEPLTERDG
jgi:AcrR family transcriptional regulator